MSVSDLAPFVAAVIRDNINNELAEENESLRAQLLACRHVAIAARDGTVFAEGSLQGATPSDSSDIAPGTIKVDMKMVEGVRPCTLSDLEGLKVRIGGIDAYELERAARESATIRDFSNLGSSDSSYYQLFLGWPTKLMLAQVLAFGPAPEFYPMELDGRRMEMDGISFKCGPRTAGRSPLDANFNLVLGEDEVEEVIFKSVLFSSYVGEESRSLSFLMYGLHPRQADEEE